VVVWIGRSQVLHHGYDVRDLSLLVDLLPRFETEQALQFRSEYENRSADADDQEVCGQGDTGPKVHFEIQLANGELLGSTDKALKKSHIKPSLAQEKLPGVDGPSVGTFLGRVRFAD